MTDDREEQKPRDRRRSSSVPRPPSTITEEPSSTIGALINSIPLLETNTTPNPTPPPINDSLTSSRRRSSVSILQALVTSTHLLPTHAARKRNFLVGSGRQVSENVMNDISSCFPNGRLLTIMVAI